VRRGGGGMWENKWGLSLGKNLSTVKWADWKEVVRGNQVDGARYRNSVTNREGYLALNTF